MNESDWLACTDPARMLQRLQAPLMMYFGDQCFHQSDRKLRLIACAGVRDVWNWLTDSRSRDAVRFAERFADMRTTHQRDCLAEARAFYDAADYAYKDAAARNDNISFLVAARDTLGEIFHSSGYGLSTFILDAIRLIDNNEEMARIIREIAGNPFQKIILPSTSMEECGDCKGKGRVRVWPPRQGQSDPQFVLCDGCHGKGEVPEPCPWITPTVTSLTHAVYDRPSAEGVLDRTALAVLADALEEVGCDNGYLLSHLRSVCHVCEDMGHRVNGGRDAMTCSQCDSTGKLKQEHVRGCWALDLVRERIPNLRN